MHHSSKRAGRAIQPTVLKGLVLSLVAAAMLGSVLTPALADEHDRGHDGDRGRDRHVRVVHDRRDHRYYAPPPAVYAPPPVAYAPPPVVYQPAPSLNVVIPLRF